MALRNELIEQGNFLFRNRSYLPLTILITGLILYVLKEMKYTGIDDTSLIIYELACFLVCLTGFFIRAITIGYTADRTSGRNTHAGQIAESINTSGMYSMCRHPLYLGNFIIWSGIALFTQNPWFIIVFILLFWVYYERIMYAEEAFLIDKFGEGYLNYSQKTPAFTPNLRKLTRPTIPFSLRKVIRQEKSGILNLFLVILLFRSLGEYFAHSTVSQVEIYWVIGFVFSVVYYVTIKIIEKQTNWLAADRS